MEWAQVGVDLAGRGTAGLQGVPVGGCGRGIPSGAKVQGGVRSGIVRTEVWLGWPQWRVWWEVRKSSYFE